MEPITLVRLQDFLQRLGERYSGAGDFYLLGGCALCLLGNPRTTLDVDYTFELDAGSAEQFEAVLAELAAEMRLDVETVPLAEFVPLPPQAHERRRLVGRYGQLDVYIFDLYSISLSKIARGFEDDLEDVMFLLHAGLIEFDELERHFSTILPDTPQADIIPSEFSDYLAEIRRRLGK
ncbi:MAG: hypothetical protein KKA73_02740 [Chloroflexi bacterium]|nr:hypothetical protein [Chloroflexota bacterium]MBU1746581.1 hypothetical protein [Chloroflexota bacterium]MBU1877996.1 hypothetical protein [Chloroflexota bacterium]